MRSLALDIGDKWIGVALSDPHGILASPLTIIERQDMTADIAAIIDIATHKEVARIIVGLPRSMNGNIGAQAEKVQSFTEELARRTKVPVEFRDERLTSVSAQRLMHEASAGKMKKRAKDDAIAAAIILQSYLDESTPQANEND